MSQTHQMGFIVVRSATVLVFRPSKLATEVIFSAAGLAAMVEIWRRLKKEICDPYRPELHYIRFVSTYLSSFMESLNYAGTIGILPLRRASITSGSSFKCASTSSRGVNAIHWSSDMSA
jgi:hypothetical protein